MKRIRIYAMTLLLMIVAAVAQAQPTTLPGSTGVTDASVLKIWGSMYSGNGAGGSWDNWGGSSISAITVNGATVEQIEFNNNGGWVGYVLSNDGSSKVDVSTTTHMNVWIWAENTTYVGIEFQSHYSSTDGGNADNDKYKSARNLQVTGGQWNLIRVALSDMPLPSGAHGYLTDIKNFSIVQDAQTETTIYVSDIFFSREVVGSDVVDYDLINGQHYRLWDIDNTWEPMRDFFSPNGDGTYTFNAISGKYRLTKVDAKKFVRVDPLTSDGSTTATYNTSDGSGAIWMRGGIRFDMPQFTSSTENWTPAKNFAMAQVAAGVYQSTMTIGKELGAENDGSTFKLFDQSGASWGNELSPNAGDNARKLSMSNYLFTFNGNGDVIHTNARRLHEGDEWQFEARVKSPASDGLTLTANRVWLNTADLQPAPTPVATRDQRVLPVFTDAIPGSIGLKKSKYSDVITWGPNAAEEYVNGDAATHTDMTPRTYTDDQSNQFIALEFKVETSVDRGWVNLHFDTQDLTGYETLHMDVKDLDGLNTEMYIWPRKTDDTPSLPSAKTKSALRFNLMDGTDANGWKSIDIPLSAIIGLDGITDLTDIDHIGIQGPNTDAKGAIAIDNVYFTKDVSFTTYDNDGRGIDWNTSTGTTCYVDKIKWVKRGTAKGQNINETYDDNWAKIHDGDIYTYFQLNRDDTNDDNEHSQILVELKDNIRVSDVEVIWANGYAKTYNVYAFESWPVVDGEIPASALTTANLLYSVSNLQMDHEPYFVTKSELQKNVTHNSRYLLLDLIERGNGDTFGYYIDEVHAGAYDEEYNTPHHLNIPDYVIKTEIDQNLEVTVRNKRNAILSDYTSSILAETVKTSWESPLLKKRGNQETVVYGTAPGTHEVTVTGTVNGVTGLVPGTSTVKVYKNWKPENNTWKSLVQPIYDKYKTDIEANPLTNAHIRASYSETWGTPARTYYPWKAADGIEASNDHSRWSSAYENYADHDAIQDQQYWVINLDDTYELTDIEVVWERAIASEYSVFGFTDLTGIDLAQKYDDFLSAQSAHLIYTTVLPEVLEFPYHDQHTGNSTTAPIIEDNRAKFLVIKPKAPLTTHTFVGHNYSIWEVYAWGADREITDQVTALKTDNISVKIGHEGEMDIMAYGGTYDSATGKYPYQESEWFPVSFTTPDGSRYKIVEGTIEDASTHKTLKVYYLYYPKVDGQDDVEYNPNDALAYIVDNDNGTYGVKVMPGIAGRGQTKDVYDNDNGATDTKSITINMVSTNTLNQPITGQFELVIYKEPMALLTDGRSTAQRQAYDDGYYSESVLKANITAETVTIDLRNVDFSYDNAGTALSSTVIPAPHTITKGEGNSKVQLNPNTIIYTDETRGTISGGNLAFRSGETWYVEVLRIFDGWDWDPIKTQGGMVAGKASFYTSIPAKHYSFFSMPFVPTFYSVSSKGVKIYKPSAFRPERNAVKLDELTSADFASGFEGKPYVLYTENTSLYKANGYAVAFTSNGEVSVPYYPSEWTNNGATIIPSYVKLNMQEIANGDAANDYYMYSIKQDKFLSVGTAALAEDGWNGATGSATEIKPFYAYMKVPKGTQSSDAPAMTFTLVDEDEVTGIDNATAETDENVEVFDVQGRYVGNCVRTHLTPGIYIVKKADGSTRKVYIRK